MRAGVVLAVVQMTVARHCQQWICVLCSSEYACYAGVNMRAMHTGMYSVLYVRIHVRINHMHIHMCISYTHPTSFTLAVLLVLAVKLKLPILIQRVVTWFLMNTKTNRKNEYNTIQLSCIWILLRSVCVRPSHDNSKLIFFCVPFVWCCSVLLYAAVCCSVLQCTFVRI